MRGEGVFGGRCQPRTWSRKQTLNGCEMKRDLDNVVLIDVDSERFDNVIIIDVPESLQHKIGGSSVSRNGEKFQFRGIISIDDDDVVSPEMGTDGGGDLESDTSSSKSFPASENMNKSVDLDDDECQVIQEKNSALRASKFKQASAKDPCRSHYGLSESSSSDIDGSDCEVMEDSSGQLHEEWVKASLKRKSNSCKAKSGIEDQTSPSCLNSDATPNIDVEVGKRTKHHSKTAFCCNSNSSYDNQNFSPFVPTDANLHTSSLPRMRRRFVEYKKVDQKGLYNDRQSPRGQALRSNQEEGDKQHHCTGAHCMDKQQKNLWEHFNFQGVYWNFHDRNTSFEDEEPSFFKSQQSSETHDNNDRVVLSNKHEDISQVTSSCSLSHHTGSGLMEKDKPTSGERLLSNSRPSYKMRAEYGLAPPKYNPRESFSSNIPSSSLPGVSNEKAGQQDIEKADSVNVSLCNIKCAETQSNQGSPCVADIKGQVVGLTSNPCVIVTPASGEDIINEREKLKETDEYKRAMEEEWASRQRQLQIQAEEAQRLRKKKRAESMRLLDMERRQKQRLEEIRETQKKDQENMNLKEKLRAEVRKELCKLETTCIDMASLLRALGVYVGGSFPPLSKEVNAAYKQALLRFHPDRASKTDIRQQVESEEKFKLISRMKEKFLLATCH